MLTISTSCRVKALLTEDGPTKQDNSTPARTLLGRETLTDLFYLLCIEVVRQPIKDVTDLCHSDILCSQSGLTSDEGWQVEHGTLYVDFFKLLQQAAEEHGSTDKRMRGSGTGCLSRLVKYSSAVDVQ